MNNTLLQQPFRSATGTTFSTQTIRNWLHVVGLYIGGSMIRVTLTRRHHGACREWTIEHVNRRRNECCNILVSDESVSLFILTITVFSSAGKETNLHSCKEVVRFGVAGIMVYSGISVDGCTSLDTIRNEVLTGR